MGSDKRPAQAATLWVRRQPPKVKAFLAVVTGAAALALLRLAVYDHDNVFFLFVAGEAVHIIGICVLIYKLIKEKTCAGLSLKTQELTALFSAVRLYCSFAMEAGLHTLLDFSTLATTLWVIYMMRFNLRSSYMEDRDNFPMYYVVVPCAVLALFIQPIIWASYINRFFWAFCVYLEAVSVLPQLRVIQNTKIKFSLTVKSRAKQLGINTSNIGIDTCPLLENVLSSIDPTKNCVFLLLRMFSAHEKSCIDTTFLGIDTEILRRLGRVWPPKVDLKIVEPFTAHYVFALGLARFLGCAHWLLQVWGSGGSMLIPSGFGPWPFMVIISEIVQTFILADFCYYYVKSVLGGQAALRLPSGVV